MKNKLLFYFGKKSTTGRNICKKIARIYEDFFATSA